MKTLLTIILAFAAFSARAETLKWHYVGTNPDGIVYTMSVPAEANERGAITILNAQFPNGTVSRNLQYVTPALCAAGFGYMRRLDLDGTNDKRGASFTLNGPTLGDRLATLLCNAYNAR